MLRAAAVALRPLFSRRDGFSHMGEQDDVDRMLQSLTRAQEALRRAERAYERLRGQVDSAGELPLVERIDAERSRVDEIIVALRGATATDRPPLGVRRHDEGEGRRPDRCGG